MSTPSPAKALDTTQVARWRLILGRESQSQFEQMQPGCCSLTAEQCEMDEALAAIYSSDSEEDIGRDEWESDTEGRRHGAAKKRSAPRVARWLHLIRNFFPRDVVVVMQRDAIERKGMSELLFEPETMASVEPSLDLAGTILELKQMVPERAKSAARQLVSSVVEELRKRLESRFAQAVRGSLDRNQHTAFRSLPNIDWPRTIRRNLKNYQPELRTIIPEHISFFLRKHRQNEWNVIIAMDQSGSMTTSLIYGGIMGAILASMPAIETHVIAFNHSDVVDLTDLCHDPVDLLFGVQLGGAEDYWMATSYCERFMHTPAKTLYILLADLWDTSPHEKRFVQKMEHLLASGVKAVGLLAISDQGKPAHNPQLAEKLAKLGMPCFGCTPNRLPDLLETVLKGRDLNKFAQTAGLKD